VNPPLLENHPVHRVLFPETFVLQAGRLSPAAFEPRKVDKGRLSLLDGQARTAEQAASSLRPGTGAATVLAGAWKPYGVPVVASPSSSNPHHCHADYNTHPEQDWLLIATAVARQASVTPRST
jgi:hypothetical protein